MVSIGLISYPLYLWHWPLLAAIRIVRFGEEPPPLMKAIAILVAFALAYLTYPDRRAPVPLAARRGPRPQARLRRSPRSAWSAPASMRRTAFRRASGRRCGSITEDLQARGRTPRTGPAIASSASRRIRRGLRRRARRRTRRAWCCGAIPTRRTFIRGCARCRRDEQSFRLSQYTAAGCPPIFGYRRRSESKFCRAINDTRARAAETCPQARHRDPGGAAVAQLRWPGRRPGARSTR